MDVVTDFKILVSMLLLIANSTVFVTFCSVFKNLQFCHLFAISVSFRVCNNVKKSNIKFQEK